MSVKGIIKCRYCGKSISKDTAYDPHVTKTPKYYCNEQEYLKEQEEKDYNKIVTCKVCLRKIKKGEAYHMIHTTPSGKIQDWYYCNEQEYLNKINEKIIRDKCKNKMIELMGFTPEDFQYSWSSFSKEIKDITDKYDYSYIYDYLVADEKDIRMAMSRKFNTDFSQRRYFEAVIRSGIKRYIPPKKEVKRVFEEEVIETKTTPRRTGRVSLEDLEDDYDE